MATTIVTKKGSGAPAASDLVEGELAVDTTNGRLYTENSSAAVVELGSNPSGNITFGDNGKAIFGAGPDLRIYHDGSNSYINDTSGTGNLYIASNQLIINNAANSENMARFAENGAVTLYYDNSAKLATTTSGIDVTGSVTADGLTVDGLTAINSTTPEIRMFETDTTDLNTQLRSGVGKFEIKTLDDAVTLAKKRFDIDHATGDISFYEDTGTTAKLFWDASAERLSVSTLSITDGSITTTAAAGDHTVFNSTGADADFRVRTGANTHSLFVEGNTGSVGIGTSSPTGGDLHVAGSTDSTVRVEATSGNDASLFLTEAGTGNVGAQLVYDGGDNKLYFKVGNNTDLTRMTIERDTGNVGIGTDSPLSLLDIRSVNPKLTISSALGGTFSGATTIGELAFHTRDGSGIGPRDIAFIQAESTVSSTTPSADLVFGVSASNQAAFEAMRLDYSGNLLVGKTSTTFGTVGVENRADGRITSTRSGNTNLLLNRLASDADIVQFYKDGTMVGSIGTYSGDLTIGDDDVGIRFDTGTGLVPWDLGATATGGSATNGTINLGVSGAAFKDLHLAGRVTAHGVTTSAYAWSSQSDSTSSSIHLYFRNPNGFVGNISTSGTATAYNTSSDYRLKENVVAISGATERLKQLKPSRFNFIADADTTVDGFLAHEVADIVPEAITGTKDAVDADGNPEYQGIDQSKLVPLLVATIQELEARIAALES